MKKIGITGGIGSGKSTVCRLLQIMGHPVYTADTEARRITESAEMLAEIRRTFGAEVFDGATLNRRRLAAVVFSDRQKLQTLNRLIHPAVTADFLRWCSRQTAGIVFVESAIMLESGLAQKLDSLVLVTADHATRIARIAQRDRLTAGETEQRMANQTGDDEKRRLCQFVIDNSGAVPLLPQVLQILKEI